MPDLPRGIYWDHGATPPRCYGIAFLKSDQSADAGIIHTALSALAIVWNGLRGGDIPTLAGARVPASSFEWLLGFGRKAFEIDGAQHPVPKALRPPNMFNSVDPMGGGVAVDGAGLRFAPGIVQNLATEEFCVQFTADTPLAVARALIETSLCLEAMRDAATGKAALLMSASFTGFNREDHRSWIDFHDGVSNLRSGDERRSVIETKPQGLAKADKWLVSGTFMAFIRLRVDIRAWRQFDLNEQEALVGRKKISGCPVSAINAAGMATAVAGCPAPGTVEVGPDAGNLPFLEPPDAVDDLTRRSHVQRANHHIVKQRIYRQGYEFFESPVPGRQFEVGLNFVSFQENPDRLFFILKQADWLGGINFGGTPGPELLHVIAGAVFACPPLIQGEAYPGASTFVPLVS